MQHPSSKRWRIQASMGVVSVRLPNETEAILQKHGRKPSDVMKEAAQQEAYRLQALDKLASLKARRARLKPATAASEDLIREGRDA